MKLYELADLDMWLAVAPHWGAWIEIIISGEHLDTVQSHPTGVRGLKSAVAQHHTVSAGVAPHWGAWIEISMES